MKSQEFEYMVIKNRVEKFQISNSELLYIVEEEKSG